MPFTYEEDLPGERWFRDWRMNLNLLSTTDIDQVGAEPPEESLTFLEYQTNNPIFILEYKHWRVSQKEVTKCTNGESVQGALADQASLPFFLVRYFPAQECKVWNFTVWPCNQLARDLCPQPMQLSEVGYIGWLYHLRSKRIGKALKHHIFKTYSNKVLENWDHLTFHH